MASLDVQGERKIGRLAAGTRRVALGNRMWAEQVLRFRAALPDAEQVLDGRRKS